MASTTWVGGDTGNETDWNTGANWSTGSIPTTNAHVVIANTGHNCALDTTRTIGSLTIQAGATIVGGGLKLIIQSEGDAAGGTEGFAVNNDGIISGNLDLEINTTTATDIDLAGTSGNFQNLKLNDANCDVTMKADCILDGTLIIAAGQLSTGTDGFGFSNLTVAGNCTVSAGATLEGNASSGATVRLHSLTVNGTYSATGGETIITGETGSGRAVDIVGTFTHNSGTLSIQTPADTLLRWPSSSTLHHLRINDASCIARPTGDNKPIIGGDLTITTGTFNTLEGGQNHALTVTGDVIIAAAGGLVCNSSTVSVDSITISANGTLDAPDASGGLTLNGTKSAWSFQNNSTNFNHNNGTITQTAAGHIKSVSSNPMYNFTLNSSSSDSHEAVFRPKTGTDCVIAANNVTVTRGVVKLNTVSHNASMGSLTIGSTGTFQASSGTTTITSEAGTGYAIEFSGTYTHNSGILKITTDANTFLKPNDKVNHLIIEPATSTRVYEYVNNATIQGDLTINAGRLTHYSSTYSLDVNGDCTVNNTGILDGGSGSIELGSLTIASGGEYRATSGTTTLNGNFTAATAGGFVANGGTVETNGSSEIEIGTAGVATTFQNLKGSNSSFTTIECNATILGTLTVDSGCSLAFNGSSGMTATFGTASAAGAIVNNGVVRIRNNNKNIIIQGASSLYPVAISGTDWDWDSQTVSSGEEWSLSNINYDPDLTTGGGGITIKLDGDCEFDAVTVSSGDKLDLNGKRMVTSGTLSLVDGSNFDASGGSFAYCNNFDNATTGTITTDNDSFLILTGSGVGSDWQTNSKAPFRNVVINSSGTITANGNQDLDSDMKKVIIGAGTLSTTASNYDVNASDMTIATGGTLTANGSELTVSGDFTTSGGLIGLSGLDFDGSTATSSPFTFLDVPYDLSNLQNSDATIEMWINPESKSGDAKIAGVINGYAVQTNRWQLDHLTNDTFNFNSHENNRSINFPVNIGKMNHIALVFDDSENLLQIYHDGKLVGENTLGTGVDLGTVGADPDLGISWQNTAKDTIRSGYMGFKGQFYMYRIFNTARTPAQLRADMFNTHGNMASTTGLQVMYQFDEGTGGAGDTVDNKEGTASRDGVLSNPGAAPNWVGAGTFTQGTSNLTMTGTSKKINYTGEETVYDLIINGTVTLNDIAGNDDGLLPKGDFTVAASKTLSSTSQEQIVITDNSNTVITIGTPATGIAGLYSLRFRQAGSINLPACTTPRVFLEVGSGNTVVATGDLTVTTELEVRSGTTFNASGNTITSKLLEMKGTGTLSLVGSTLVLSHTSGLTSESGVTIDGGPGTTILGSSAATTFESQNNFVIVGKVENLNVTNEELSVTGQVINCTGEIHQQFPTVDHDQQLDFDTADDRDVILGRDLDKNTELINS